MGTKRCPKCGKTFIRSTICPNCNIDLVELDGTTEQVDNPVYHNEIPYQGGLVGSLVSSFKGIIELVAWIILIIGAIVCAVIGYQWGIVLDHNNSLVFAIVSFFIGLLITYLLEALIIPPLVILFSVHSELQDIKRVLKK